MEIVAGTGIGFLIRAFLHFSGLGRTKAGAACLGLWEGVVLHGTVRPPQRTTRAAADEHEAQAYAALVLRMCVDLYFTRSLAKLAIVGLWTGLGIVLLEVASHVLEDSASHSRESRSRHRRRSSSHRPRATSSARAPSLPPSKQTAPSSFTTDNEPSMSTSLHMEMSTPLPQDTEEARRDATATRAPELSAIVVPSTRPETSRMTLQLSDILATPGGVYSHDNTRGGDERGWESLEQPDAILDPSHFPDSHQDVASGAASDSPYSTSSVTPEGTPVRLLRPPLTVNPDVPAAPSNATPASTIKMLPPVFGSPYGQQAVLTSPLDALGSTINVLLPAGPASVSVSVADQSNAGEPAPTVFSIPAVALFPPTPPSARGPPQSVPAPTAAPTFSYAAISARPPVVAAPLPARARPRQPASDAGTEAESVLSTADRAALLSRADLLRTQARAQEAERDALETARREALRDGRNVDALKLKVRREEALARAGRLHRRAERRYHLGESHSLFTLRVGHR